MNKEDELDKLINDLKKIELRLQFLLDRGNNDEKLVDKKRKLIIEIKKLKNGL
jgi:hypothetical protein